MKINYQKGSTLNMLTEKVREWGRKKERKRLRLRKRGKRGDKRERERDRVSDWDRMGQREKKK